MVAARGQGGRAPFDGPGGPRARPGSGGSAGFQYPPPNTRLPFNRAHLCWGLSRAQGPARPWGVAPGSPAQPRARREEAAVPAPGRVVRGLGRSPSRLLGSGPPAGCTVPPGPRRVWAPAQDVCTQRVGTSAPSARPRVWPRGLPRSRLHLKGTGLAQLLGVVLRSRSFRNPARLEGAAERGPGSPSFLSEPSFGQKPLSPRCQRLGLHRVSRALCPSGVRSQRCGTPRKSGCF